MRERKSNFFLLKIMSYPFSIPVNICISQLLCYSCSSWQRLGDFACAQFETFVVKVGSTCENKTDLDEKRIFHYKLSKKLSEAHRNISILKILLYDTNS